MSKTAWPLLLALGVLAGPAAASNCPPSFQDLAGKPPQAGAPLRAPNRQIRVWAVAAYEAAPHLVRSWLVLRDEPTSRELIALPPGTWNGQPRRQPGSFSVLCPVDWSSDSRLLLVEELVGVMNSEFSPVTWTYDTGQRRWTLIDSSELRRALEAYWKARGTDLHGIGWELDVLGWAGGDAGRVVFKAYTPHDTPGSFLGLWSVTRTGRSPRLVSRDESGFTVRRFGVTVEPR